MEKIPHIIKVLLYLQILYFRKIILIPEKNMYAYIQEDFVENIATCVWIMYIVLMDSADQIIDLRMLLLRVLTCRDSASPCQ